MELSKFRYVYFIGIGGIGMSALARWFVRNGYTVAGYDRSSSALTEALTAEGMYVCHTDDWREAVPRQMQEHLTETLVVFTPAVPSEHPVQVYFREAGYTMKKRAEVLGLVTRQYPTIAVAGTHGKTTTSSMIAHILKVGGRELTAFLGGILKNYDTNLLLAEIPESQIIVAEADEYDRSFLQLRPRWSVITSTDADHLDIYGTADEVIDTFTQFAMLTPQEGKLFLKKGARLNFKQSAYFGIETYGVATPAAYHAENIRIEGGFFYFDWHSPKEVLPDIQLGVVGYHNVENATVAIAVAKTLGVADAAIREAMRSFAGAQRRFDFVIRTPDLVLIDDYAHHPTELEALLHSARALYPDKKITLVFQPHLFTRTRDFMAAFAQSFTLADELLLLEIYPAREQPIAGVSAEALLSMTNMPHKRLVDKHTLADVLANASPEVVITAGAGDIDRCLGAIKARLQSVG